MTGAVLVDAGVDPERLLAWMDREGLGEGPLEAVEPIPGGTQNVMLRLRRAGREYVLRRGPRHLRPRSNEAIRREMTLLDALGATAVPHPALVRGCADDDVLGATFYLMDPVDGVNAAVELPPAARDDPARRHAMGLAVVDALAELGEVDHAAVGLASFGRPEGFLERQVPRWLAELERYQQDEAYRRAGVPDVTALGTWLEAHRPSRWTPGILHGDFHLANVLHARDDPSVVAIVDWEMATIGDPLLDLGWLIATWGDGGGPDLHDSPLAAAGGLPGPDELVARYGQRSSRDLTAVRWYVVLACFKLGIVLEGTFARSLAGQAPVEIGERLRSQARGLFAQAEATVEGASAP